MTAPVPSRRALAPPDADGGGGGRGSPSRGAARAGRARSGAGRARGCRGTRAHPGSAADHRADTSTARRDRRHRRTSSRARRRQRARDRDREGRRHPGGAGAHPREDRGAGGGTPLLLAPRARRLRAGLRSRPPRQACGGEFEALWREALRARPDFRAAALALEASEARGNLAVAEIFTLAAIYDSNGQGTAGFESGPGISAVLPILNQNQGARARATADAEIAASAWVALLVRARLELAIALVRERETATALRASRHELTPHLEARLAQARSAHALGEVPYLGVLEADRALLGARLVETDLLAEHERACVEIERSIGTRVPSLRAVATAGTDGAMP